MKELISVIVLVYNAEKDIKKCLNSILSQTYSNLEIIVVNDGSKDNTSKILHSLKDPRIKLIERENKGTYYSRVEGYQKSNGAYIVYVDSDDYIENNMIEVLYQKTKKYNCDVVHCENKIFCDNTIRIEESIFTKDTYFDKTTMEPDFFDILYKTFHCNSMWKQMYKREVLKNIININKRINYGEDLACNIEVYKIMNSILFINDALYVYRINSTGITNRKDKNSLLNKMNDIIFVYQKLFKSIEEFNISNKQNYQQIVCLKTYYYLTIYLYMLTNYFSRKEFISKVRELLNQEELKLIREYRNKNYKSLNINNRIIMVACNLLIDEKLNRLYYFDKYIYGMLKRITVRFRK